MQTKSEGYRERKREESKKEREKRVRNTYIERKREIYRERD